MKVLSLQGDFRSSDLDVIPALKSYSKLHDLEFRCGRCPASSLCPLRMMSQGLYPECEILLILTYCNAHDSEIMI